MIPINTKVKYTKSIWDRGIYTIFESYVENIDEDNDIKYYGIETEFQRIYDVPEYLLIALPVCKTEIYKALTEGE